MLEILFWINNGKQICINHHTSNKQCKVLGYNATQEFDYCSLLILMGN